MSGGGIRRKPSDLGPRQPKPAATRVADTFVTPSSKQSQLTIRIDADVHKRFKIATTREDLSMGEVVETKIREWLSEHE
jgi:hypothetical protein